MSLFTNRQKFHNDFLTNIQKAKEGDYPAPVLPKALKDWLAKLTLLYGVPVDYMIPDFRMLPTESIRFFYLDRNWLDRLVDGAMSVGVLSTREAVFNLAFFKEIYRQVDESQMAFRAEMRGEDVDEVENVGGPIAGFIFRSQVVADFPGIEIVPLKEGKELPILRMDTLSSNTLLCLISGVPNEVQFIQPGEGLNQGIFLDKDEPDHDFHLFLRALEGDNVGKQVKDGDQYKRAYGQFRKASDSGDQPEGVVNIADLADQIKSNLPINELSSGGLAIQLTKTAQRQKYNTNIS